MTHARSNFFFTIILLPALAGLAHAQSTFVLAPQGCSMAHCDMDLSGAANAAAPLSSDTRVVITNHTPGASLGLGCTSNYKIVACTYNSMTRSLIVFDGDGNRIFDSSRLLDSTAFTSVPLISTTGEVIAADDQTLVRFAADGNIVWQTSIVGTGTPISPVLTNNGVILLATSGDVISSYDVETGARLGAFPVKLDGLNYGTQNTPSVNGNRVYVSMAAENLKSHGRLVAIDVDSSNKAAPLSIAWSYEFGGPSGASPLFQGGVVYFDGSSINPGPFGTATLFAVRDMGKSAAVLWADPLVTTHGQSSPAIKTTPLPDPRGGMWIFIADQTVLQRIDMVTGALMQTIDMNSFFSNSIDHCPTSALTMALPDPATGNPVMLFGVEPGSANVGPAMMVALELGTTPSLLWHVEVGQFLMKNAVFSQFPIVADPAGLPRVVFPGGSGDTYFVGSGPIIR
jgi:hypothetical protein